MIDDRAASSAISYTLVIALTLALTTGLVLGTESLVQNQREAAAQSQLEVIGQQLASTVMTVDQFNETEAVPETASVVRQFPNRVSGSQYQIAVVAEDASTGRYNLYLDAVDSSVNVSVPVRQSDSDLRETRVNGGTLNVTYDESSDEVVIRHA